MLNKRALAGRTTLQCPALPEMVADLSEKLNHFHVRLRSKYCENMMKVCVQ